MTIDNWVRELTGSDLLVDENHKEALVAYQLHYEHYMRACKSVKDMQKQCVPDNGNSKNGENVLAAYKLACDPEQGMERENELLDELIKVNQHLRQQQEINMELRQTIQSLHELKAAFNAQTSTSVNKSTLEDTIAVLKQKQLEYQSVIDHNGVYSDDMNMLFEVVGWMERREQLRKEWQEFHNLPGDLAEALTEIARLEAELLPDSQ